MARSGDDVTGVYSCAMNLHHWIEQATIFGYRLGAYAMVHLAEDAAMLALIFC